MTSQNRMRNSESCNLPDNSGRNSELTSKNINMTDGIFNVQYDTD